MGAVTRAPVGFFFVPALTVILLAVPPKAHVYPGARDIAGVVTLGVWGGSGCLQWAPESWATAFCPCPSPHSILMNSWGA